MGIGDVDHAISWRDYGRNMLIQLLLILTTFHSRKQTYINPLLVTHGYADIIALKGEVGMRLVEGAKLLLKKFIQRFAPSVPEAENERSVDSDTPDGECG